MFLIYRRPCDHDVSRQSHDKRNKMDQLGKRSHEFRKCVMKKTCLTWFGWYVLIAVAFATWFLVQYPEAPANVSPRLPPLPMRAGIAAVSGLACGIPAFLGIMGLYGIGTRLSERARLIAASRGETPKDGVIQPFVGRMTGRGETLTAPLSERPCLLYHYQATHYSGGSRGSTTTNAEGYALAPSAIEIPAGQVQIRAYLEIEFQPDNIDVDKARERLSAYQRTATLFMPDLNLMRNYRETQKYALDDDGAIRYDHGKLDLLDSATRFEEHVVQSGDEVVIFGMYSAARNAIVPDPKSEVMHRARLRKGSISRVARGLVWDAVGSGAVGLFFVAVTVTLTWLFFARMGIFI